MKVAFAIVGALIVLILFGTMMAGIQDAKTEERTDSFAAVATGAGDDDADVSLVGDLYESEILNVVSITSDYSGDAPLPDSYLTVGHTLTVDGLAESQSRTLEVTYRYTALTGGSTAIVDFLDLVPVFVVIAIILIIAAAIFGAWASRRG